MQPISFQDQIEACLKAGEQLVPVAQIKALKSIAPTTRVEWCRSGKLPSTQINAKYYTIESIVIKALAEMTVQSKAPKHIRNANADIERVKRLASK